MEVQRPGEVPLAAQAIVCYFEFFTVGASLLALILAALANRV